MRRMAILALSISIAATGSIALFTLFWRIGYVRPHFLWGILSLAAILFPMAWLVVSALWRCGRGPCRLRALGWLLVGATPLVWSSAYVTGLILDAHVNPDRSLNAPVRVVAVWASTMFEIEARWRYPRWIRGRHIVLIDDGRTPSAEKLVDEMDDHVQAMADLLGQPVPNQEFPWVRGPLFGLRGRAIYVWAICACDQTENPGELKYVDRHEVAHTLITGMGGPDQYPPRLLVEGWAESQSEDRNRQIRNLARDRRRGIAQSLQDFVRPDGYDGRAGGAAYSEGGPLVHYLIGRFGGETFFRLYSGVRRDSFHDDCRAILGESWETLEQDFWKWIGAEDQLLAEDDAERPDVHVELAPSVAAADWQELAEGYREANKDPLPLPSNSAFVLEGELEKRETENAAPTSARKFDFRAIFEDQQLWVFDNNYGYSGHDWFLMATRERCGELTRGDSGWCSGGGTPGWAPYYAREGASTLLSFYRGHADPASVLPFRDISRGDVTYQIERVVRPTDGKTRLWNVQFTRQEAGHDAEIRYEVELDPANRWWITRITEDDLGGCRCETDAEYEHIGDAFMPVTLRLRFLSDKETGFCRWHMRPMSEVERQALKRRVEEAFRSAPDGGSPRLRHFLLLIVIACPLVGATLLVIPQRCEPARAKP